MMNLKKKIASTYLRQPEVQIQNTKFNGIVQLSPTFQQLSKDMECAIEDNIASPNLHGCIIHLSMRKLNKQEELLVLKFKSSILVHVKGMPEEIIYLGSRLQHMIFYMKYLQQWFHKSSKKTKS